MDSQNINIMLDYNPEERYNLGLNADCSYQPLQPAIQ